MPVPSTVHKPTPAEARDLVNETGSELDSIRRKLMGLLHEWDGVDSIIHKAIGHIVLGLDDANQALVDSQLGVEPEEDFDHRRSM